MSRILHSDRVAHGIPGDTILDSKDYVASARTSRDMYGVPLIAARSIVMLGAFACINSSKHKSYSPSRVRFQ